MTYSEHYDGYKWVKVRTHSDEPIRNEDGTRNWEAMYNLLKKHHFEETIFLIEEVRKLAKLLDDANKRLETETAYADSLLAQQFPDED